MNFVVNGVEYHIETAGVSGGKQLLLLHGFTGDLHTWDFLIPILSEHVQLIMIDIVGHGKTSAPKDISPYKMESAAADIKAIVDHLDISKIHVLGYSMGGRLALNFAVLYPECIQSLILESASPGLEDVEARKKRMNQDHQLAHNIQESGIESFVNMWENIPLFASQKRLPAEKQAVIRKQRLDNHETGLANSLIGMGTGAQPSRWESLDTLSFPTLLLTGELDVKFCEMAEKMSRLIKNCDWKIINDVGHAIHSENEKMFGKIVYEFLAKQ